MQTVQKNVFYKENQKTGGFPECGKNKELSPRKSVKIRGKLSYTRSYPQYTHKSTTSVVQRKHCQVRKFVLGFVIKSQKKGSKEMFRRVMAFLEKRK